MTTLITWPHGSAAGEREGQRLHKAFADTTTCVGIDALDGLGHEYFNLVIVVGHDEDIARKGAVEALIEYARPSDIHHAVFASFGPAARGGAERSDLATVAQTFADNAGGHVLVASRALSFDEVGSGALFVAGDFGIDPAHPADPALWKEIHRSDSVGDASAFA